MAPDYPLDYLPQTPWLTVVNLLNHQLGTDYPEEDCILASKDLISEAVISITVAIDQSSGIDQFLPPTTVHTVSYRRLNIADTITDVKMMYPSMHYRTTADILTEICSRYPNYGLTFNDFVMVLIPPGVDALMLTTDRYSLRWYGNLTVSFPRH